MKLVRLLSPLPDVPSRIEPLGLERPRIRPTWGNLLAARHPVRELPPDERPSSWLAPSEELDSQRLLETADPLVDTADTVVGTSALLLDTADAMVPDGDANRGGPGQRCPHAPARIERAEQFERASPAPIQSAAREASTTSDDPSTEPVAAVSTAGVSTPLEPTATTLSGPQRYSVQFTASEEYVALVEEAKALLAHALPSATLAELHLRAMRALVAELKKRKFAVRTRSVSSAVAESSGVTAFVDADETNDVAGTPNGDSSSTHGSAPADSPGQRGRTVPAVVRRRVFERDENRCAYVDARGERCRETQRLELHHHEPFARGGPATAENLSLYCSAHNALAAEQDFGRASSLAKREERSYFTERTLARAAVPDS